MEYDRQAAVSYAHRWAYFRNRAYQDFSAMGGDCTNFASQCVFAGSGVMNPTPTFGWYYYSASNYAPAWTGVSFIYDFLVSNLGPGPYGRECGITEVLPGDLVQIATVHERFHHTPVIVAANGSGKTDGILVAAHSRDCDMRPLSSYYPKKIRFIHIEGVRT